MRSAIALCFLAVLCTVDATILDILLLQVRNTKLTVGSTIQQLERTRNNVEEDVNLTIMKKWLRQMEDYTNYVNPILNTIHKDVEDAKAKGKYAQQCYDAAVTLLKNFECIAYTDVRQCQEIAKSSIKNELSFIDQLITTGRELMEELDNIFPDCYEKNSRLIDIFKLHSCIRNQHGITKVSVKNFKTDSSSAGSTAKSASNIVLQQATDCVNNAYSTARSKVAQARSAATTCLNNLV